MSKIAVVTDSNSGITQERAKELGIYVLPMPFFIDGELYLEDITLTQEQFYEKLRADSDISTSQPSPGNVMELWESVLKEYDEIVCIPMSSGLRRQCLLRGNIKGKFMLWTTRESRLHKNNLYMMQCICAIKGCARKRLKIFSKKRSCRQVFISQLIR